MMEVKTMMMMTIFLATGNVAWSRSKTLVPAQCSDTSWTSILVFGQLDYGGDHDNDHDDDDDKDEDYSKTCDDEVTKVNQESIDNYDD